MSQSLGQGLQLPSASPNHASTFERQLMLDQTSQSDSSAPSLRDLYREQQLQLERIAAANDLVSASASAAMYTAIANASAKKKPAALSSSSKIFGLRFSKAAPTTTSPASSHFRYVKAKSALPSGVSTLADDSRSSLTSLARVSSSVPVTPPTPTGRSPRMDDLSLSESPLSLASSMTSATRNSLAATAIPLSVAKKASPAQEQSVFDWSPNNSPKHVRSYMTEFLGGGTAQVQNKSSVARARPTTNPALPRASEQESVRPEPTTQSLNNVKHRNRKGSVSAYFSGNEIPIGFAVATREMEVVTRRNRRMSSIDASGSDLEWSPPPRREQALISTPPQCPQRILSAVPAATTQIPLPIFGQTSLRELRKRNTMQKPDGLKLLVANKDACDDAATVLPPVPASPSSQTSTDLAVRQALSRALSPAVPARGGSLHLKKGSSSGGSRSPLSTIMQEWSNPLASSRSQDPLLASPTIEKGLLFSSLGQGTAPEEASSLNDDVTPPFSIISNLSAEIMSNLCSASPVAAAAVNSKGRDRSQSVSTIASNYSGKVTLGRPRKNSIIALPEAGFEQTKAMPTSIARTSVAPLYSTAASDASRRGSQVSTRPRGGSVLQRLKDEEARMIGRNRKGSILSVYSVASAEEEEGDLPEAEDEDDVAEVEEGGACSLPYPAASSCGDSWQAATSPPPSGQRLSHWPSPITEMTYRSTLLSSRPASLCLSDPRSSISGSDVWSSNVFKSVVETAHDQSQRGSEATISSNSNASTSRRPSVLTDSTLSTPPTPCSPLSAVPPAPLLASSRPRKPVAPPTSPPPPTGPKAEGRKMTLRRREGEGKREI